MNFRNISSWCIRNPVPPIVLFVGLMLAGIIAFMGMEVNNNPDIDFPAAQINISQPGAAPTEMERRRRLCEPGRDRRVGCSGRTTTYSVRRSPSWNAPASTAFSGTSWTGGSCPPDLRRRRRGRLPRQGQRALRGPPHGRGPGSVARALRRGGLRGGPRPLVELSTTDEADPWRRVKPEPLAGYLVMVPGRGGCGDAASHGPSAGSCRP